MNRLNPSTLIVVEDLKQSIDFYTKLLGLEVIEKQSSCAKLRAGLHNIYMFQGDAAAKAYAHGYESNSNLLLTVTDLDSEIERLKSHGVEFVHETPNVNRWGRYAAFKDPSGIVIELFELFPTVNVQEQAG